MHKPWIPFGLLLALVLPAAWCQAESDCRTDGPMTYSPAAGDTANSTQLRAVRSLSAPLEDLQINVCQGELLVRRAPDGAKLQLLITSPGADKSLRDYLQAFSVDGSKAIVSILVPGKYHPTITLLVPHLHTPSVQINQGGGNTEVEPDLLGDGSREINLGAGHAKLLLGKPDSYATLQVNIGMGELKDERPGGQNDHFVVSRQISGTGHGSLEVNVGAGVVELKKAEEE